MRMDVSIRIIADANFVAAFSLLAEHGQTARSGTRVFGGAVAIVTDVQAPFFNPVTVVDTEVTVTDVEEAVRWSRARGANPSIQVAEDLEDVVAGIASDLGFVAEAWRMPRMVLRPIPPDIPEGPADLEVLREAGDHLDGWFGAAGDSMRGVITPGFARHHSVRFVTGYANGRPVCHAVAIGTEGVVGIYAVGTIEDSRGRGYGRAITWAAIRAGRDAWSAETAILQSSEMGISVYRAMGFIEIGRYAIYRPPPEPAT
jgi:ribosomal protein S18 acetylase RimI-like enzyme